MTIFKKVAVGAFCIIFSKMAMSADIGLNYDSAGQKFILKKECIAGMRITHFEPQDIFSLNLRLKDSSDCAQQLNAIIKRNINGRLKIYFNDQLLMDSFIAGYLKTELGYKMPLENKQTGKDILSFYKISN